MEILIVAIFVIGYFAITIEHVTKIDKLIPALIMMALAWATVALGIDGFERWYDSANQSMLTEFGELEHESKLHIMQETLLHHFGKTCEILIFLLGAMTIVEIIDQFNGFNTIRKLVKTNNKTTLLWIMSALAFVLSAIIDNLTATIVLVTLLRKLIPNANDRLWFAGLVIIAANAGGAWSPIGDVTTTMLWIGNKVTTIGLITNLLLPSLVCMIVPSAIAGFLPAFRGTFETAPDTKDEGESNPFMLYLGLGMIVFVPIFKTITHLPPYVGMMFSLAIVSLVAEIITNRSFSITSLEDAENLPDHGPKSPTFKALSNIELPSILFFLGILMTVAALESLGLVFDFGQSIRAVISDDLFIMLLGVASAIIDNVPLVAASMGMFDVDIDDSIWHFVAYAAGTGGSMLIIGSAAGVVAMGMEKINFFWYLKNISLLALAGYVAGAMVYLGMIHLGFSS